MRIKEVSARGGLGTHDAILEMASWLCGYHNRTTASLHSYNVQTGLLRRTRYLADERESLIG